MKRRLMERKRLVALIQSLVSVNGDEEVEQLTTRVLAHLGLERR
jgi:hypothetical protein